MRASNIMFAVVLLTLVVSLLCIWFYPTVQDFMANNSMWNGLKHFSSSTGAKNIDALDALPALPENTALIVIPYLKLSDGEMAKTKDFVENGGTLLLMDDYGYGNSLLEYLGTNIRFSTKPLLDPLFCYKNQRLPKITDFTSDVKESHVSVVTLNHATALTGVGQSQAIAWSSTTSFLDTDGNESWDQGEPKGPLTVMAESHLGKGTLVVIADPSIIINSIVGLDDNYRLVEFLISRNGEPKDIMIDRSNLPKDTIDVSKLRLQSARDAFSSPFALIGIVALIFLVVSRFTFRKGELLG